jgi:hypothetical protein
MRGSAGAPGISLFRLWGPTVLCLPEEGEGDRLGTGMGTAAVRRGRGSEGSAKVTVTKFHG